MTRRGKRRILCERFACVLSRAACGTGFYAAIQRFAPTQLQGCLGCPVGPRNLALVPAAALNRARRGPADTWRLYERARNPKRRAELRPDPVRR